MENPSSVRIDKYRWAVRLYKTRTVAAEACKQGKVTIDGQVIKPSREVKVLDVIQAQVGDITRTVKVVGLLEKRVGAKLVSQYAEDLTPASEYEKRREPVLAPLFSRPKGMGRPTKRDRRRLEGLI